MHQNVGGLNDEIICKKGIFAINFDLSKKDDLDIPLPYCLLADLLS